MKLGYTIMYVPDVDQALAFYENAFGFKTRFKTENGNYGELDTGATALGFVREAFLESEGFSFLKNRPDQAPAGIQIAFVAEDVSLAYQKALGAGAVAVKAPAQKPWGQLVAVVRDLNGVIVEICSEIAE